MADIVVKNFKGTSCRGGGGRAPRSRSDQLATGFSKPVAFAAINGANRRERREIGRKLFENGVKCSDIAPMIGYKAKTLHEYASKWGWKRLKLNCVTCGVAVPPDVGRDKASRRVCAECTRVRHLEKSRKRRAAKPEQIKAERVAYRDKLHAEGRVKPMALVMAEHEARRQGKPRSAASQRSRFIAFGEAPSTRAGAIAILQTTLTKLLAVRCEAIGQKVDTVQYKARYAADVDFRERERTRTSGKRWGNRAEGRDDGTLTRDVVRKLFSRAKQCPYCWQPMHSADKSLDHMHPLSLGGWHALSNVLVCCRRCNSRKHDTPYADWLKRIPEPCERALAERAA